MKLYIADSVHGKTTKEIIKWFTAHGHDVRMDMGYDPRNVDWADSTLCEWADNNAVQMDKWFWDDWDKGGKGDYDWTGKNLVLRPMDIEVYTGYYRSLHWNHWDNLVYVSKQIFDHMNIDAKFPESLKITHIPLSVDMNEWTFKERKPGRSIGYIGNIWESKNFPMIVQVVDMLQRRTGKKWKLKWLGRWDYSGTYEWATYYRDNILKSLNIDMEHTEFADSVDEWMEGIDYLVTTSLKDAFSLIVGEAMAKGIKSFPHNFAGSDEIWGKYAWSSMDDLVDRIINEDYNSSEYRKFVEDNYSNERIMPLWEKVLEPKS